MPSHPTKPPLRLFATTLWEYPSQHYDPATALGPSSPARAPEQPAAPRMQGDKNYTGHAPDDRETGR